MELSTVCGVEKCIRCNTDGRCEECIHGYEVIGESESEECVTEHGMEDDQFREWSYQCLCRSRITRAN